MAQNPIELIPGSGLSVRTRIGNAILTVATQHEGPAAPNPTYPGLVWADTTANTVWQRTQDDTDWNPIGDLDIEYLGLVHQSMLSQIPSANKAVQWDKDGRINGVPINGNILRLLAVGQGCIRLNTGHVVQWGGHSNGADIKETYVEFPMQFPNSCEVVIGCSGDNIPARGMSTYNWDKVGFRYNFSNNCHWIAIGY